jgi:hypothetical protein
VNDFDQAARFAAKLDPAGFFRWLFPDLPAEWIFRRWRDTRTLPFPGEPDRTCDTVGEFENTANADLLLAVVEFQSHPIIEMLVRLLEYQARLLREPDIAGTREAKLIVVGALLNLTGPVQPSTLEMRLPGRAQVGL